MEIMKALTFPFRGAHAWANIGSLAVCFLIPIVGPIVMLGYMVSLEKRLIETSEADAPRFEFGKFSHYLTRGVQPFLVSLVIMLVFIFPLLIVLWGTMFGSLILIQQKHEVLGIALMVCGLLVYTLLLMLLGVGLTPLILKSGLQENFKAGMDFRFMLDYLRRVGLLAVGVNLVMFLVVIPLMPLMMCFPLSYAVVAAAMLAQAHLRIQLYLEYLRRGGEAIVFVPDVPEGAFPVIATGGAGDVAAQ